MKNILNLVVLSVFTMGITLGLVDAPQNNDFLQQVPVITEKLEQENSQDEDFFEVSKADYLSGVFITTVYNLDFPSNTNLSENTLKKEIDEILDNVLSLDITDVFFQVRPCADAFYYSDIFPTSVYLTGSQDKSASFDVLQYYIDGCHQRGLKLHAWINPYRITKSSSDVLTSSHIALKNPDLVITHSDGNMYFDPALPEVLDIILDGVEEIILNYDVDGIHFDDYFYPSSSFDDSKSYEKYGNGRSLGDFRRDNVTNLISSVNTLIDEKSPDVLFGVSPAGIWANAKDISGGSDTAGTGSYSNQYADTKKWVEMEILDYIAPQIYWNIGFEIAEYITLADWWNDVCDGYDVDLFICHANYKEYANTFEAGEIERQIEYNMTKKNVSGSIFFRYEHLF